MSRLASVSSPNISPRLGLEIKVSTTSLVNKGSAFTTRDPTANHHNNGCCQQLPLPAVNLPQIPPGLRWYPNTINSTKMVSARYSYSRPIQRTHYWHREESAVNLPLTPAAIAYWFALRLPLLLTWLTCSQPKSLKKVIFEIYIADRKATTCI